MIQDEFAERSSIKIWQQFFLHGAESLNKRKKWIMMALCKLTYCLKEKSLNIITILIYNR